MPVWFVLLAKYMQRCHKQRDTRAEVLHAELSNWGWMKFVAPQKPSSATWVRRQAQAGILKRQGDDNLRQSPGRKAISACAASKSLWSAQGEKKRPRKFVFGAEFLAAPPFVALW